jgi:hypothetical protein
MFTEHYAASFLGLGKGKYTLDSVADIWQWSADSVYRDSGIYVSGEVYTTLFAGQGKKKEERLTFVVNSVRSPVCVRDKGEYQKAYKKVLRNVRRNLGNPRTRLIIQEIQTFYFERT